MIDTKQMAAWCRKQPSEAELNEMADALAAIVPKWPLRKVCARLMSRSPRKVSEARRKQLASQAKKACDARWKRHRERQLHANGITVKVRLANEAIRESGSLPNERDTQ